MRCVIERFSSGWLGISLALRPSEIDNLVLLLNSLKSQAVGHFHLAATDYSGDPGVADVEVGLKGEDEADNMAIA